MSYVVTTNYDNRIPSWQGNGTPFGVIACHDTEGGQGRAGALGTIQFLIDRADRGASYHEVWWYHESSDEFGVIRIVPSSRAAGSVAPQTDKYFPTAWVKESLGVNAWDPNQGIYAVSIAGRVADVNRYSQNPRFLAHAHRRMLEILTELGLDRRAEHFQFNPSIRTDWGKLLMPALGGQVTLKDWSPPKEILPMAALMPIKPTAVRLKVGSSIRLRPDLSAESKPWTLTSEATVTAIGTVQGENFGAGPLWYAYVINTGGLRYFHSQDILTATVLVNPASVPAADCSAAVEKAVAPLRTQVSTLVATVDEQANKIAGLMTELGEANTALVQAEAAAAEATALAEGAMRLRDALRNFLG